MMENNNVIFNACEDVVLEILCRLPSKDLIRCKCVCRAWHRLICEVCICRFTLDPPLSCLSVRVETLYDGRGTPRRKWFNHVDIGEERSGGPARFILNSMGTLPFRHSPGRLLNSCNGLLLFHTPVEHRYYVCNPTTREFVLLPGTFENIERYSVALAFDPHKSPHYKVVRFVPYGETHVLMDIYSSEFGQWAGHILPLDQLAPRGKWYKHMVFFDGTIYRLSATSHLMCFDLDVVNARQIDLPKSQRERCTLLLFGILGASMGHLCYARLYVNELNVWFLDDQCKGGKWILKHSVTSDFAIEVPLSMRHPHYALCPLACYGIHPNSDIVFIGAPRMILSYDFKSNTLKEVVRTREGTHFAYPVYTHVQCIISLANTGMMIFNSIHSAKVYEGIRPLNLDKPSDDRECI